jgi:CRISPR type III-A-associated RAMP protein Csm4
MTRYRIQITPRAPFFTGLGSHARKSGVLVHSDTLHAALTALAARTASPWLEAAERLRVSSICPCWNGLDFYPKPFLPVPRAAAAADDPKAGKRWKAIRLVSGGMLAAWFKGDTRLAEKMTVLEGGLAALEKEVEGQRLPLNGFLARDLAPAVTVDRCGAGATPFDRRGIRVNTGEGVGAWFLAELEDAQAASFRELAGLLGTHGLGGERSVGYGQFDLAGFDACSPDGLFAAAPDADAFMTLSLYHPGRDEVEAGVLEGSAAYDSTVRGGWIDGASPGGGRPRHALRMCLEGSVFPMAGGPPRGGVRDVRPEGFTAHPVWRSGLALGLAFRHPGAQPGRNAA